MLEHAADAGAKPRAFLRVGGLTVARQQVALALALNCERVVCIAAGLVPELIELQHVVEAKGAQFHVIGQARALAGLVSSVDEIVVFSDGLFVSTEPAALLIEEGQAILVQPVESGLAAGFERIDLNHAAGGIMRLPGRLAERIGELPPDCDVASSLLRIALQAGIRQKNIPAQGKDGLFWNLIHSDAEAHALEPHWIRHRTQGEGAYGPTGALALFGVRSFGPTLLHAGSGAKVLAIAAGLLALLGFGSGWLGLVPLGFGLVAVGWLLRESAAILSRIESESSSFHNILGSKELYALLIDAIVIALAAWGSEMHSGQQYIDRLFPPFILLALLRILPRMLAPRWTAWFGDRALLSLGLMAAVLSGLGSEAIHVAATLAALVGIFVPLGQSRLTRL
jgi:hypothetical protein